MSALILLLDVQACKTATRGYDADRLNLYLRSVWIQRMVLQKLSVASFRELGANVMLAWRKGGLARYLMGVPKTSG